MKVFLWSELDSLEDHLSGMAFAHAEAKKQAIKGILKVLIKDWKEYQARHLESRWITRSMKRELQEVSKELRQKEPIVFDSDRPCSYFMRGSA